jgi:hypothetical protein
VKTTLLALLLAVCCAFCAANAQDWRTSARGKEKDWQKEAVRIYPELGIEGSELNKLFVRRYRVLRSTERDYFITSDWPVRLARECAKELDKPSVQPVAQEHRDSPSTGHSATSGGSESISIKKLFDLSNPTAIQVIVLIVIGLVILGGAYSYINGWWRDPVNSFIAFSISLLIGGVIAWLFGALDKQNPSPKWGWGGLAFIFCDLFGHFADRCEHCGALNRSRRISSIAVGERTVTRRRERVRDHYDTRGNRIGTTKEHEDAPETKTIFETTWECKRCGGVSTTTN